METKQLLEDLVVGIIATTDHIPHMCKANEIFGKPIHTVDAIADPEFAKAYWSLDALAFGSLSSPKFMKMDCVLAGGCSIALLSKQKEVDPQYLQSIGAQSLPLVPIAFLDLHKIAEGLFTTSGFGIAPPYQGLGLSKYLIYAATIAAGIEHLKIPTQLSNVAAHKAWLHLGPLKVVSASLFHDCPDSMLYQAHAPQDPKQILQEPQLQAGEWFEHSKIQGYLASLPSNQSATLVGYSQTHGQFQVSSR